LDQAARIDGATRFQAFILIVMPLSTPGIIATAIYSFIGAWNECEVGEDERRMRVHKPDRAHQDEERHEKDHGREHVAKQEGEEQKI
ncbi:ABC transporter permease subunit, partial [Rhizobium johnstonii]|uniref:ABC transporter permease subunit n=1 Tax=Rhizobium johnstonii TaxID=3019933 RepID=UPI003F988473